jgi:hypothetical protein
MVLSRGLGLPTTFYFALWRVRQFSPKQCHAMGHRRQPTLKLMPVLILPLPAGTGYYTRNVQISEDNVLSLSQLFDWFYLPHFLLLQWVVVKYKGVRSPLAFHIGTHHKTKVGDRFQNIAIISVIPNMVKAGYRG